MRKKSMMITIILAMLLFVLSACLVKEKTLKIGLVGTMTGTQSDLSVSGRRGIEIAVDQINAEGGINGQQVELVIKNDENNPIRAVEIVREFADENVSFVIGHYTSGMMLAAYDELIKHDILYLGPTISADSLCNIDDNFIRFIASTKEQAEVINQVAKSKGHKNFAVIYDEKNIGFNQALYSNFKQILEENDGKILWDYGYERLDQNVYRKLTAKYQKTESEIDAVFIISSANDLALMAQEFRKNELACQIYGPLWAHTNDLIRVAGDYAEDIMVVSGIDYEIVSPDFRRFQEEYKRRFGEMVTFSSIYSYEAMIALTETISDIGKSSDFNAVKEKMVNSRYQGLQGEFSIDMYGDNTRSYMMDKIKNNEYKRID